MITNDELLEAFERNLRILHMQTKGLSHADSLLQLPFRGNCLNWVIGHILVNRENILKTLGEKPLLDEAERAFYTQDSEPIFSDCEGSLQLSEMLSMLDESQSRIIIGLERLKDQENIEGIQGDEDQPTLSKQIFFSYFHETYHVGQTEMLRQLAGKDDKVI